MEADYRLYYRRGTRFFRFEQFAARGDEAALLESCRRVEGSFCEGAELWSGERLIERLVPSEGSRF